jgi:hypothetical protein
MPAAVSASHSHTCRSLGGAVTAIALACAVPCSSPAGAVAQQRVQ